MKVIETELKDCLEIQPKIFSDNRGFFLETFQTDRYQEYIGIDKEFVQHNCSRSSYGTLRGLHFQKNKPQGKLVRVSRGRILDAAIDLRIDSPSFGKYILVELNDALNNQLWIPPGFAHGFITLSTIADVEYKCTQFYDPKDESSIVWNDPTLKISWPKSIKPILSEKDSNAGTFLEYCKYQ